MWQRHASELNGSSWFRMCDYVNAICTATFIQNAVGLLGIKTFKFRATQY